MKQLQLKKSQAEIYGGMAALEDNTYPGRVAIQGLSLDGRRGVQAYALMGRRPVSRTRIFVDRGLGSVHSVAPGKGQEAMAATKEAALIFYQASVAGKGVYVVTNGAQTPYVHKSILGGDDLETAVKSAPFINDVDLSIYEPDEPNSTPRIAGVIDLRDKAPTPFGLSIVRKDPSSDEPIYETYATDSIHNVTPGLGFVIQTYLENGNPLPSFDRQPYAFPLGETAVDTAHRIWDVLNKENRVALMVRSIDLDTQNIEETCVVNSPAPPQ